MVGYLLSGDGIPSGGAVEDVALLGRRAHMEQIRESGLRVVLPRGPRSIRFRHCFSSLEEFQRSGYRPDAVVVTVKTYSLPRLREEIMSSGALGRSLAGAAYVLLMNGMGNREVMDLPGADVRQGITSMGVVYAGPGQVKLRGKGKTIFEDGVSPELKATFRERFAEKGFQVEFAPDFAVHQWGKLLVNSVINPITALCGGSNGIVLSPDLTATVERVVDECLAVAAGEGVQMERDFALALVKDVARMTSGNTSSMLKDAQMGRETEIESINGYVIRQGRRQGISTPVNEALYGLVKSLRNAGDHLSR
ncbi:MAG: 2-dehydropantoate 2-reductase [Methanosarcinales archaeon]|nr:2-dehydropantoate 2-reductase [Methanosarcinales archaeon]